jgi:DNA-binding SARP family transcriptional activator
MPLSEMVIKSKLIPPQPQKAVFHRKRLQDQLVSSLRFPLTMVHAGTGFGKTTALIELSNSYNKVFWYNITEPDRDPTLFLAHLVSAFLPVTSSLLGRLEKGGSAANSGIVNALINQLTTDLEEEAVLILDDFHLVSNVTDINLWLEQLVDQRPPHLHIAIACRQIPETPAFIRWRVKGNVLVVDQSDLSFTQEEIFSLFTDHYQFAITNEQAQTLFSYTDGWIIALQMIWQRLQTSRSKKLDNIMSELPSALSDIFNFLAQEVLMRQPEPIQKFLISTAVLRQLDAESCNNLLNISDSQCILQLLYDKGLFISTTDNINFRYQRLFQDFLLNHGGQSVLNPGNLHKKAAEYFTRINNLEEAVFHHFSDGNLTEAAIIIELIGPKLLEIGRLRTLAKWIEQLDDHQLELHPTLNLLMGDVQRLRSKFEDAINCYNKAEKVFLQNNDALGRSNALRSKAQVYLDTIRPLKGSSLLEEAISLLEPQEYPSQVAALLDQLAENKLNSGKPHEARALHKEANMLRSESDPDDIYLEARALLRTGRLFEGSDLLESSGGLNEETSTQRPQRFHREMPLLLSLIYLMMGSIEKGELFARQGIEIGHQLDSPFVEAVGLMRLGHAYQLYPHLPWRSQRLRKAREFYEKAIELVKPFNVMRVQVEPLWGLCRFYGYQGNITEAKRYAAQATEIAQTSGDYWFVALLSSTMGTSYALAGENNLAETWLTKSVEVFKQVGDTFGETVSLNALILNNWLHGQKQKAITEFANLIPQIRTLNLGFTMTKPSQLGIQDSQLFLPLLVEAYNQGVEKDWIGSILKEKNLDDIDYHPGYGLEIRTLGPFEVTRGTALISPRDWQREKARQLMQFFVNGQGRLFTKEQICDRMWPHLEGEAAGQNLKVALNALNRALEPNRESGMNAFFIIRRENMYGLNPAAQIVMDVDDFYTLCKSSNEADLREALSIYTGDYLCEIMEDRWANDKRESIRDLYLGTAMKLAEIYIHDSKWDEAVKLSHDILAVDNCNEAAYQFLMRSHAARGNRATVQAVYQRCCLILREDLDVEPSDETTKLYHQLSK